MSSEKIWVADLETIGFGMRTLDEMMTRLILHRTLRF